MFIKKGGKCRKGWKKKMVGRGKKKRAMCVRSKR